MPFDTSDTKDLPETTEAVQEEAATLRPLSVRGIRAMQGEPDAPTPGEWVDRGIQEVPLADLPEPEGIENASDFEKASPEELRAGLMRLQEMRPAIASGEGASSDYWREFDRQRGLAYPDGYQKVYESFYGQDAIRLDKDGNQYDIVNGRHRIFIAKQMGLDTVPARVREKVVPE